MISKKQVEEALKPEPPKPINVNWMPPRVINFKYLFKSDGAIILDVETDASHPSVPKPPRKKPHG